MASLGTKPGAIRFGPYELDPANRELRKRGNVIKLQPRQFAVLHLLVERAGQVVSRDEIRARIWDANTFVDFERAINFAINQIRAALGDDAEKPRFVETIPRLGYRFLCPIEISPSAHVPPEASAAAESRESALFDVSAKPEGPLRNEAGAKTDRPSKGIGIWLLSGIAFAVVLMLAAVFIGRHYSLRLYLPSILKAGNVARTHTVELTKLRGHVYSPVFSPDGKQIAFLWNGADQNKADLYVQVIG